MASKELFRMINFKDLGDERGKLVVIEGKHDIPFEIARVFYILKLVYANSLGDSVFYCQTICICT